MDIATSDSGDNLVDISPYDISELNNAAWQIRWIDPGGALAGAKRVENILQTLSPDDRSLQAALALSLRTQAWANRWLGFYELAGEQAKRGLPLAEKLLVEKLGNIESQALLMKLMGDHAQFQTQDFAKVAKWYYDALSLLPTNKFSETKVAILLHIGMLQIDMGIHQEAHDHFQDALVVAQDQNDSISEARVRLNLAELHRKAGDHQLCLNELEIANTLANLAKANLLTVYILTNLGRVYMDLEEYPAAEGILDNGMNLAQRLGDRKALSLINITFGQIYHRKKEYDLALTYALQVAKQTHTISNAGTNAQINQLLYQIYKAFGNSDKALTYFEKYNATIEAQLNGNTQRIVQEMQARHKVELSRQESEMVRARNAALRKEVADRILAEEALKIAKEDAISAREKAEMASRAKGNFLAHMSHEIRTPLNGILGMTELLQESPLVDEQKEMLSVIHKSGGALLAVVNDILDFAKVETGRVELEEQTFDVIQCVQDVIRIMEPVAAQKSLQLTLAVDDESIFIRSDELRLTQILNNLIGNAIKFTHQGRIAIGVRAHTISLGRLELEFTVSDTGIGMAADAMVRIFEPFRQADNSTTRRYGGTGLGLALCRQLVELMGGRIWVNSQEGEGSTFHFTIHAAPADGALKEMEHRRPELSLRATAHEYPLKILIAEDNPVNQKVLVRSLTRLGYEPVLTNNGAEAVDEATRQHYDLILMDIHMPVMDGLTASREIRDRILASLQPKIIAVTASVLAEERAHASDAGIDGFLAKPFRQEEVSKLLKDVFEERTMLTKQQDTSIA